MSRHILLTGGAGYIGSHTAKAVAKAGMTPVVLDSLVYGHREAVKWGPLVEGDIADSAQVAAICSQYAIDSAIHFAAFACVGESVADPALYYRNNVAGTVGLLDGLRAANVNQLVFSSTCATYGEPEQLPITEETAQAPVNPYGRTKLMMEQILADYESAYGFRAVNLRYFNASGADPDGELGENHDPETHLIPLVLAAAAGDLPHITMFGDDYPTADGSCIRDYVHVCDLADAHLRALDYLDRDGATVAVNLGYGQGYSVREVIDTVERVTGRSVPLVLGDRRAGDPPELIADSRLARELLGWQPQHDRLEFIVETAWQWYQKVNGAHASSSSG
ncbi:UDP-glucose 4-epimerase GalE [Gammaproteobacteria bacterium]|nr:UDP-glucose 4-epimerase GalE [Gammaproteobacteria bacterium]